MHDKAAKMRSKMAMIAIASVFVPAMVGLMVLAGLFFAIQSGDMSEETRNMLMPLVGLAAVANIAIAGVSTFILMRALRSRLSVLVENAQRIPKGLPLHKTLDGEDEFAYLDQTLHTTARELRKLEEHRRSLMEMVAHDLRSPLMSCEISLEILTSGKIGDLDQQVKKQLDSVKKNVWRTIGLVNDLLTVDKLEAGRIELKRKDMKLGLLIDSSVEAVAELARKKQLLLQNTCVDQIVYGDDARLGQVVVNLLSNAIHFSPNNSMITIGTEKRHGQLAVFVKDQGPGIAFDVQNQLFDKFYQASGRSKIGFGLGLTICKHIVQLHGGTVGVESEPGKGSKFWFTIPPVEA